MKLSAKAQASLEKVIAKFQTGDLSPITKVARIRLAEDAPASNWSFSNRVLAFIQTGELDCRGYRQWQAANRYVKKGSRAAFILFPRTVQKEKEDGETYSQLIGFGTTPVFPLSATEGDEPMPDYTPTELPPLADVAQQLGIEVHYQPLPPDRLGDCTTDGQSIRLGTQTESAFFHELAHAAHARINGGRLKGKQDTHQETVAEFTAAVLMELYGYRDHTGDAWNYIKSYAPDPLTAITKALATVEKVLDLLINTPLSQPV